MWNERFKPGVDNKRGCCEEVCGDRSTNLSGKYWTGKLIQKIFDSKITDQEKYDLLGSGIKKYNCSLQIWKRIDNIGTWHSEVDIKKVFDLGWQGHESCVLRKVKECDRYNLVTLMKGSNCATKLYYCSLYYSTLTYVEL